MTTAQGKTLGRYRLESLLGRGGMAEVWRAFDSKLERTVAVKVILASYAEDAGFLSRFEQEARLVASLEHPGILPIYDFGEEKGIPFLVMPYLDGGTLRDRMTGRPVPAPRAVEWVRQLGEALDAAHAAGVLHRDVKPTNVLVGKEERLALADFGIAKMLESVTRLTATGMVVGTPIYMSPEQAQGRPASPSSDLYALGVIAYELLTGRPPFDGESALALMHQHVSAPVPPATDSNPSLPAPLDAVLARALSKEPADRPPTGRALAAEIGSCLGTRFPPPLDRSTARMAPPSAISRGTGTTALGPIAGRSFPIPATPRPGSTGLTSDETLDRRAYAPTRGEWLRILAVTGAILVAAGGVGLWALKNRGREATSPAPPPSGEGKAAPAPTPVTISPLVVSFQKAVSEGRLAPPAEDDAMQTLARMRRDFPGAPEIPTSEDLLVAALRVQSDALAREGRPGPAVECLSQAIALRPMDASLLKEREELEASIKGAAAPTPTPAPVPLVRPAPRGPGPGGDDPSDLREARGRLNPSAKPAHRLEKADFDYGASAASAALSKKPGRLDALSLSLYTAGGLAYVAQNDAEAARLLSAAWSEGGGARVDGKDPWMLLGRLVGAGANPAPWEMALAYGDARGEAENLVALELSARPNDPRALMGRAILEGMRGRDEEAIAAAKSALAGKGPGPLAAGIALFVGEEYERLSRWDEAVRWYGDAGKGPGQIAAVANLRAARVLRDRFDRKPDAAALFHSACAAGNLEACRESGEEPPSAPPEGPRRNRRLPRN